jgi:biopolymer transport protein ExbD
MRVLLLVLLAGCAAAVEEGGLPVASRELPPSKATPPHARTGTHRNISAVTCVVHADRNASWGHILWVLTICAEERTALIEFVYQGGGVIPVRLPEDRGLCATTETPDGEVAQRVIGVDEDGTYSYGDLRSRRPEAVKEWIAAKRPPDLLGDVGEIRASPFARWRAVAPILDLFHAGGIDHVELYGTAIPVPEERVLRRLPPIRTGFRKARGTGLQPRFAWRREDGRFELGEPEPFLDEEELDEPPLLEEGPFEIESSD